MPLPSGKRTSSNNASARFAMALASAIVRVTVTLYPSRSRIMRSELPMFGSSSKMRMRWAGILVIGGVVAGPAAHRVFRSRLVQLNADLVVTLLLNIGRRVAQQVLPVNFLANLDHCIFKSVLFVETVLSSAGVSRQYRKRILHHRCF